MNNEEKILSLLEAVNSRLETMDGRLDRLEIGQAKLEAGQAKLEAKVDAIQAEQTEIKKTLNAVFEQTATLTEFKTSVTREIDEVRSATKQNSYEIAKILAVR